MNDYLAVSLALGLVVLNGFFVAAEFALVKVSRSRLDQLVRERRPFAGTARWLYERMERTLSCCQLGITMASLALGWVGEPAFARLLDPAFEALHIEDPKLLHAIAFVFSFSVITALHLVIGEQAPKIFALRRPEPMFMWCAAPLRFFYVLSYPFLVALEKATSFLLSLMGVDSAGGHDTIHNEHELRAMVASAHAHGEVTSSEARLIHGVFEFDDLICRKVMVPRNDVVSVELSMSLDEVEAIARRTRHTRIPVCEGSLDSVVGILHVKDLIGREELGDVQLRDLIRPPKKVPETMPISALLRHFQGTHQLMAIVVDEHGTVTGIVTLENVLEPIVGPVDDEFDEDEHEITPDGPRSFLLTGGVDLETVRRKLNLPLSSTEADTLSGLLTERAGRLLETGDVFELKEATAEVLEVRGSRAERVRIVLEEPAVKAE